MDVEQLDHLVETYKEYRSIYEGLKREAGEAHRLYKKKEDELLGNAFIAP